MGASARSTSPNLCSDLCESQLHKTWCFHVRFSFPRRCGELQKVVFYSPLLQLQLSAGSEAQLPCGSTEEATFLSFPPLQQQAALLEIHLDDGILSVAITHLNFSSYAVWLLSLFCLCLPPGLGWAELHTHGCGAGWGRHWGQLLPWESHLETDCPAAEGVLSTHMIIY